MSAVEDRRRVLASFGRRAGPLFKLAQGLQVSATKTYACKVRPILTRSHCQKSVASFPRACGSVGRSVGCLTDGREESYYCAQCAFCDSARAVAPQTKPGTAPKRYAPPGSAPSPGERSIERFHGTRRR